ncbi:MAG: hypothetical protein ACRD2L_17595, partial [Terriglobia bacterium]
MKFCPHLRKHDPVEFFWVDSSTTHGWSKEQQLRPGQTLCLVHSMGFVVQNTRDELTFTASLDLSTDYP